MTIQDDAKFSDMFTGEEIKEFALDYNHPEKYWVKYVGNAKDLIFTGKYKYKFLIEKSTSKAHLCIKEHCLDEK